MADQGDSPLEARLIAYLGRKLGRPVTVDRLERLAGGVSRDTWAFEMVGGDEGGRLRQSLVLRMDTPTPFIEGSRSAEYELIRLAGRHGVPVPRVLWCEEDAAPLGAPFLIMERIEGESRITRLHNDERYAAARERLPAQIAEALARIHRITPRADPANATQLPRLPQREAVACQERLYRERAVEPHPVLELGLRWLAQHVPPEAPLALVHGDFRPGNLLFDTEGLRAVLDWELAYFGDPLADVAWVALRSWRGGRDTPSVGGLCSRETFRHAYEAAGGQHVEADRMRYWDVFALVRWGVITLMELRGFLDGAAHIELASLGRRTAEVEWDLLTLLEREG